MRPDLYAAADKAGREAARRVPHGDKLDAYLRAAGAAFFAPEPEAPMPYVTVPAETIGSAIARAERALEALRTVKNEIKGVFPMEQVRDASGLATSLMDDAQDAADTIETKLRAVLARLNSAPAEAA